MSNSGCLHEFEVLKTDSTLIEWLCNLCHSGPHWLIYECQYCNLHACRLCIESGLSC